MGRGGGAGSQCPEEWNAGRDQGAGGEPRGRSGGEGSGAGLQGRGSRGRAERWAGPGRARGGPGCGVTARGAGRRRDPAWGVGPDLGLGLPIRNFPRPEPRTCALGARLRPHGRRRGLAGLQGQGARLAPARPVRSARRRLLQPRAGRVRAAGAGVATHELAAAGRHQVSGGARAAGVRGCSRVGRAGGDGQRAGRSRPAPRPPPWTPVTRLRRNRGCGA